MKQNNISFDSYFGRVIDPTCYRFIETVNNAINNQTDIISQIKTSIFNEIKKCVDRLEPQNKNNYKQYIYIIFMKLLKDILNAKTPIKQIFSPTTHHDYLLLKSYLLPLLDIMTEIMKVPEYHMFGYEYLLNFNETTYPWVYIVENENDYSCGIKRVNSVDFGKYLMDNQLCFNLSGALFKTHENHTGILNHFLTERLALRKQYKTKRDTFPVGCAEYQFFDRRQLSMKINANSSYGLTGMSSFLFSNRQLAMSTTLSGRLCLKISQACGELYLNNLEKELL